MTPSDTVTAYNLLISVIRNARTIGTEQKQSYLDRLEGGEWNDALRIELQKLCEAENNQRTIEINGREQMIESYNADVAADAQMSQMVQNKVLDTHEKNLGTIQTDFVQQCAKVERDYEKSFEQKATAGESNDIDAIRKSLMSGNSK